jgi:hypothetical protein
LLVYKFAISLGNTYARTICSEEISELGSSKDHFELLNIITSSGSPTKISLTYVTSVQEAIAS